MITRTRTVLTLAAVAMAIVILTATSANAGIILEEQFIYEAANLDTLDGGTGFDGPWVATAIEIWESANGVRYRWDGTLTRGIVEDARTMNIASAVFAGSI